VTNRVRADAKGQLGVSKDGKPATVVNPKQAEVARLKAEVALLKMERDIAKSVHRGATPSQWQETRECIH